MAVLVENQGLLETETHSGNNKLYYCNLFLLTLQLFQIDNFRHLFFLRAFLKRSLLKAVCDCARLKPLCHDVNSVSSCSVAPTLRITTCKPAN